jgi:hypothetical protein
VKLPGVLVLPKVLLDPLGVVVLPGRVADPPDDEVVAGLSVVVMLPGRVAAPPDGVVSGLVIEDPSTPVTLLGMAVVSRGVEAPLGVVVVPKGL